MVRNEKIKGEEGESQGKVRKEKIKGKVRKEKIKES